MQNLHSRPHLQQNRDFLWDLTAWRRDHCEDNSERLQRLRRNLRKAMSEELTPRQRQMLEMYYDREIPKADIARNLQVSRSTVSRTIARGQKRLRRYLQYSL